MIESEYKIFDLFKVQEVKPGVAHVQFNRPKALNAFDTKTWTQYGELFQKLDQDSSVKLIVISGVGKHFCAGLDVKSSIHEFETFQADDKLLYKHIVDFQANIGAPAKISTPTISLLHGISIGLALDIVSATSIRVITKDAKLSIREIAIGIVADIGSLQRLPSCFNNTSKLFEYALTADFFNWKQAQECGLVSYVEDTKEDGLTRCIEIATKILQYERINVKGTKQLLSQMKEQGVDQGLEDVAIFNSKHLDPGLVVAKIKRILKL